MTWEPDYLAELNRRLRLMRRARTDAHFRKCLWVVYQNDPVRFVEDCCFTYDPRKRLKLMPFLLFERQKMFVRFIVACLQSGNAGLVEKCRDMGFTWLCVCLAVWLWLFTPGASIGFGSRKQELVDRVGDPDSIFEKIRMTLRYLPEYLVPVEFVPRAHATFMKIINPANGSTITGEIGDSIGRGGRKQIYFKDEAQPLDEPVLTPSGWRKMIDLSIGDEVMSPSGKPIKITGINDCGFHEVYRITLSDGSTTRASENHRWVLSNGNGVRTHELFKGFRRTYGKQIQYPFYLPSPIIIDDVEYPLHPYVVGALLGDGSVIKKIGITSADPEIPGRINQLLPKGSRVEKRNNYWWAILSARRGKGIKGSARLAAEKAGIWGMKCNNKFIPESYRHAGYELLRGLMDTDGCFSNGTSLFVNSSLRLCNDVMALARSLGGRASIRKRNDGTWVVYVRTPECPFWLPRKALLWKRKQKCQRAIFDVSPIGKMPVRCITVEGGLYVTKDYIVTHNSAHYERPELIEAALGDNTDVQIDISSVNGAGNVFYRRRMAGEIWEPGKDMPRDKTWVFVGDWRDDPRKDLDWYERRRSRAEAEGLLHIFAQEVDRDYFSSQERIVIRPEWVKAAIDAHKILNFKAQGEKIGAQDVADGGGDRNAFMARHGVVATAAEHWPGEAQEAAKKTIPEAIRLGITELCYDCIGVGAGFKAQANIMREAKAFPATLQIVPWDAAGKVQNPEARLLSSDSLSPKNEDHFKNLKAQGWWALRTRFYKVYRAVHHQEVYPPEDLISLPADLPNLHQLVMELSQPVYDYDNAGKMLIDKTPEGTSSPNLADACMMCYFPVREPRGFFSA